MNRIVFSLALALVLSQSLTAYAQAAKDAVRAFAKLDARIETGISYRDYVNALGDVNFELKLFSDGPEASARSQIKDALNLAMLRHLEARALWGLTFGRYSMKSLPPASDLGKAYLARYPDASKGLREGGASFIGGDLSVEYLLQFLWRDASDQVRQAMTLLSTAQLGQ